MAHPVTGQRRRFELSGRRVCLVGAGKATLGMAGVLDGLLGARIHDGAVVVKEGQTERLTHVDVIEAAHPIPDERSHRGGLRLLGIAERARAGDLLVALVTGGSSALAVVPDDGISLDDKVAANRVLLASGAGIMAVNDVRKHLSRIKGGRLGRAAGCEILNFTVSDVVGDPLDYVTDLTVPDRSTFAAAGEVCDRYGLWDRLPPRVSAHLRRADPCRETCRELPGVSTYVVADAAAMCKAAARAAEKLGYAARVLHLDLEGESAAVGRWFAAQLAAAPPGTALVAGGEATTTLGPDTHPEARGGPSQEGAVAGALELGRPACGVRESCLLFLDSDGSDGPTDAAGGLVDDTTAGALTAAGVEAAAELAGHTSERALAFAGDAVHTGPTGTNVNDLRIGLTAC